MQTIEQSYTVKEIMEGIETENIRFDHPMQRKPGQWDNEQQSLLIHSILADFAIPQSYALQLLPNDFSAFSVLDGKQRFTTVDEFMHDAFRLSKDTPTVNVKKRKIVTGENGERHAGYVIEEYEVAEKCFSELSENLQDKFRNRKFSVVIMVDCTDEDIEDQVKYSQASRHIFV